MRRRRYERALSDDSGFTLIEIVVAFGLLALASTAMVAMLMAGLRGVAIIKSEAIAKLEAEQTLEKMRALPFYVDRLTNTSDVDLLDLYFPNATGAVYDSATKIYTYTITTDAQDLDGTITTVSQFIPVDTSVEPITVDASYDSSSAETDTPPSRLLSVSITVAWTVTGVSRSFEIESTVGSKDFVGFIGRSESQVSGLVVETGRTDGVNTVALTMKAGTAGASGFLGDTVTANSSMIAAKGSTVSTDATECPDLVGASGGSTAPPTASEGPSGTILASSLLFPPCDGSADGIDLPDTKRTLTDADVTGSLPLANAEGTLYPDGAGANPLGLFGDVVYDANRELDVNEPVVSLSNDGATASSFGAEVITTSTTYEATADMAAFAWVEIMPTAFAPNGIVQLKLTAANVSCESAKTVAASTASGSFTGKVRYWDDDAPLVNGEKYVELTISDANSSDPLAALTLSSIVVNRVDEVDIALSDYIASWSSLTSATTANSIVEDPEGAGDDEGVVTTSSLSGIIQVATTGTTSIGDDTTDIGISFGALSCSARYEL